VAISFSTAARSARASAINTLVNAGSGAGKFRVYDGTRATNANTAVGAQTLLLEFTLQDPAFTESGGVLTLDVTPTITDDALATATATWGRFLDSDNNVICDVSEGSDFNLSDDTLESGQTVTIVSFTFTEAAS
jgi:hypothetical protein